MRLIIAGTRTLELNHTFIEILINTLNVPKDRVLEVVSGGARGIDYAGEKWAASIPYNNGMVPSSYKGRTEPVKVKIFEADWETHGKAAGPIRNKQMAEYADALLLIWNGESPGSKNMKEHMQKLNKPIYEVVLKAPK